MKNAFRIMLAMALVMALAPQTASAQRRQRQTKEFEWKMPEKLTGLADFDKYLYTCDTLYNRITTYRDSVTFYTVKKIVVTDKNGNALKNVAGQDSTITAVVDQDNNIRGSSEALQQYLDMTNTGLAILADLVRITAETATASVDLATSPLLALSYGKYLKAGPKIVAMGTSTIKGLLSDIKTQRNTIRAYKKTYTESGDLQDPTVDPATIADGVFADLEVIQKPEDVVGRELAAALERDGAIGDLPDGEDIDIDSL